MLINNPLFVSCLNGSHIGCFTTVEFTTRKGAAGLAAGLDKIVGSAWMLFFLRVQLQGALRVWGGGEAGRPGLINIYSSPRLPREKVFIFK
jgi:hypothetical protein